MSAPLAGRRVTVVGTSRADLNGTRGQAVDFDKEKGRYNVRLDGGKVLALKPENLEECSDPTPPPQPSAPSSAGGANGACASSAGLFGIPWPTVGLIMIAVAWVYQFLQGSGGAASGASGLFGGDGDEGEFDDQGQGFLSGHVREVVTLDQLKGTLSHHADSTGLPVVVDFFSHSCGPCRMIAPAFKRLAKELKGQAVFIKVDVNRNYEAASVCNIRGMPTFQFYHNRKKVHEFSGADDRGLRQYAESVVHMAEKEGTFVGLEVSGEALREFYTKFDATKVEEADALATKYREKTALLMRVSRQKYGERPRASQRGAEGVGKEEARRGGGQAPEGKPLADRSVEELQAEVERLRAELDRRGHQGTQAEAAEDDDEELPYLAPGEAAAGGAQQLVILGGGPAGLAAAIYAARAGLRPLVVAPALGGQLLGKGVDVENFPGVVGEQATGRGLVELMRRQALSFETRFVNTVALGADLSERPFKLRINGTDQPLLAETVILALGAESRWLQVKGEQDFRGRGVSACATCDGFLFRGKDVMVVGGGDHAMEDALYLARSSRRVTLVHRRDRLRASKVLADRLLNHSSISVMWNAEVDAFHGAEDLSHATLRVRSAAGAEPRVERLEVAGAFVAIGHEPGTAFLRGQLEMDEGGYVALKDGTATSVRGVFAAGDAADRRYRQAVTASGTGAMAALDVQRFLSEEG